ncbi:hypothetical protein RAA17_01690 [Komagataeibacter rhaeticus]|nr:hypothetical protein [Komagataeibacter rhaeticus]
MTAGGNEKAPPHYVSVVEWVARTGMSRTQTYRKLNDGKLIAKKLGSRTVIDFRAGLAWLASLPNATFIPKATAPVIN